MQDASPQSPEERAKHPDQAAVPAHPTGWMAPVSITWAVTRRVLVGVFSNGFMYAGNLAYLALLTVFPFFILAAAIASLLGQRAGAAEAVSAFLHALPPGVADLLRKPIADVLAARTGGLLWFGALIGLWTVGSFVETLRDIFRRAYGVTFSRPFWHYRLGSMLVIIVSVILALVSLLLQGVLLGVQEFIYRVLPWASDIAGWIGLSRLVPGVVMFAALYALFYSVTPSKYRYGRCRKWPGALFTTLWWVAATALLPMILAHVGRYDLTYGSLAGVIVALLYFYIIGLGLTIGAELNAALAEADPDRVEGANKLQGTTA
ncbi:YihY/virulence factor BrkB family protein [Sphingomonas sp. AR_OL41]|uniref:YihY/virulence factor BrkB family protein n=1 Tax=Sphingomonas sp. AR_OL41 TaxID=3042729 RepID=UPI00247FFD7D|nr:YihY/virulence factor BrkB family protein [Sphingomonas sp. AR_OL41]MDH7972800.1 YihY/virulence factor BrkB family protein [Sphingomonas sp. AR_OL41]